MAKKKFSAPVLRLVLRAPKGPQWRQMNEFYEKLRYNILLWDDLTMGKLGVSPMEGGQRNI